jgi:hypothetical protein
MIRTSPDDDDGATVTTVTAGTLLDVVRRVGDWYEVRLPAAGDRGQRLVFVRASDVEVFRDSPLQGGTTSPMTGATGAVPRLSTSAAAAPADWQARYDRAVTRKRAGKTKLWIGGPLLLAGAALQYYTFVRAMTDDDPDDKGMLARQGVALGLVAGGGVIAWRGQRDIRSANEELLVLEHERAQPPAALLEHSFGEVLAFRAVVSSVAGTRAEAHVRVGF